MDVIGGFNQIVDIDIAGFTGIDAHKNMGIAVNHLGGMIQGRTVAAVSV